MAAPAERLSIPEKPSKIGKFIQTYHSFLSSFVIGAAGLVATSIWQYRQSETASRQAEAQQRIAQTQAENNWRIERAEILSKNLDVLASSGHDTVEQRYGVLLSLTRGNIIDPELTVSYALELGKDNPAYMKSVLASTADKSYERLASAFELTCQQRFGLTRDVPLCQGDKLAERSHALTELLSDELNLDRPRGKGPEVLLLDERAVQNAPLRLSTLFSHRLIDQFERRQLHEIERFEAISAGAKLVSALVLAPSQPNAFVAASEAAEVLAFRSRRAAWLHEYLFGASCNNECKGKLIDVMLTELAESEGRYDASLRELFARPRAEVAMALARLHARLLSCQVSDADAVALRDHILIPALAQVKPGLSAKDQEAVADVLSLLALTPDPDFRAGAEGKAERAAWEAALAVVRGAIPEAYDDAFTERRASAQVTRKTPPAKLKPGMFCTAEEVSLADFAIEE